MICCLYLLTIELYKTQIIYKQSTVYQLFENPPNSIHFATLVVICVTNYLSFICVIILYHSNNQ